MLRKRIASFGYAFKGIALLVRTQPNARIHLVLTGLVIGGGFFFQISPLEWLILILTIALVLAAEAFNSALEALTDLVSPDWHHLAGNAKDLAAGAVLLCAIGAVAVGLLIFLPKIIHWL